MLPDDPQGRVRVVDRDRYLVTLYAPPAARAGLFALFALDLELAQVVATTHEPMLGEIRLAWWREQLVRLDRAAVPAQPTLSRRSRRSRCLPVCVAPALSRLRRRIGRCCGRYRRGNRWSRSISRLRRCLHARVVLGHGRAVQWLVCALVAGGAVAFCHVAGWTEPVSRKHAGQWHHVLVVDFAGHADAVPGHSTLRRSVGTPLGKCLRVVAIRAVHPQRV